MDDSIFLYPIVAMSITVLLGLFAPAPPWRTSNEVLGVFVWVAAGFIGLAFALAALAVSQGGGLALDYTALVGAAGMSILFIAVWLARPDSYGTDDGWGRGPDEPPEPTDPSWPQFEHDFWRYVERQPSGSSR